MDRGSAQAAVVEAADAERAARRRLDDAVRAARAVGLSWADIGRAYGIARQSARERWEHLVPRLPVAAATPEDVDALFGQLTGLTPEQRASREAWDASVGGGPVVEPVTEDRVRAWHEAADAADHAAFDAGRTDDLDAVTLRATEPDLNAVGDVGLAALRALVVRDLVAEGTVWDQAAYHALTYPVRSAGITVHPDDAGVGGQGV